MPPLGEHGIRPDAPASALRPGSQRRTVSPRMHAADFGEQIVESGYAAAYPGGSTSWLRIESQLQHLEELVTLPEIEGGGGPSTLLVEGRRETSEVAEPEHVSLVRAELVLLDEPTPTPRANSAAKPPQAPRTPRTQVAPLYSSGSRKRSLGLGRVDYVIGDNTPATEGGRGPAGRGASSSRSPSPSTRMPRSWQSDNVHAEKIAQRESASEAEELKNLRDWNHTLSYELSMERNELHDVKRQLAALREELQRTKSARNADAEEIESLRQWNHTLSHEVEEERRKNEALNNEADAGLAEVAQLREKLHLALIEVEKNRNRASEVTDESKSKDEYAKQNIRLLQERLREADEGAKQNIRLLQERLREADEDAKKNISLLQEKLRVAEQTAKTRIADSAQKARENTYTVVDVLHRVLSSKNLSFNMFLNWKLCVNGLKLKQTGEHLQETKMASQRAIAEAEMASQTALAEAEKASEGAIAEVRLQKSITEAKFARHLDHGRWTTELVLRKVARGSKTGAFFEWKMLVASLYVRQSILKYALGHVHRFLKKRIWERWKSRTNVWRRELRSNRVAFEAFVKQCFSTIVVFFSAWKHLRGAKRHAQDRVLKIVFQGLFFSALKAWNTWVDTIREKKRLRRVVRRIRAMAAWKALDKWIWLTKERKRLAAAEAKVVKRLFNVGLWKAFDTWMCRTKGAKQLAKAALSVLNKWRQSCLWKTMHTWEDVTREHKRQALTAVKSLKHWLRYSTWKAFDSWQEALHRSKIEAEKQRMALMLQTKTLRRWWQTGLFAAFDEWVFRVRDNRRVANAAMRVVKGWVMRSSLAAFHSWKEGWQQAQRVAHLKIKVLRRMQLKFVWAAFDKWETVVEEARREGERQQALVLLQTRVVRRIRAMAAWKALDKWQYVVRQRKAINKIKAKVLGKMHHAGLWSAMNSWVEKVRESKRLAKTAFHVIRIWTSKSILGALHKWLDVVDRSRRVRKLGMAVVTRWTMASMWQSFESWHLCTHQSKRQRILLDKIIQRWANAAVVGAFDTWAWVAALHSEQRQSATKILARWRHADVLGAFAGWLENVHKAQQSRVFLSRAVRRWVNVNLSKCWRVWIDAIVDMKRQDYLRTRSLQRWTKNPLFRTFSLFKEHVLCALRQRNLMARIARRWMMVAIIGAWDTWVDVTTRSMKIKLIARRVIQRWRLNSLVGAWNLWTEMVSTACRFRVVGSRALRRWTLRLKSLAFYGYLDAAKRQAKILTKASISIQRWGHLILYHALQGWQHGAREQKRLFGVATKIVSRWARLSLSEAWNGWKYGTQDQKRIVNISSRIMRRWFQLRVSSAFQAWIWFVFDSLGGQLRTTSHQNLDKLMARIVQRMRMALSGKAFDSWRFVAQRQAKVFRLFNATIARLRNRLAFAAFQSWQEHAREQRRLRMLATHAVKKWVMGSFASALEGWRARTAEQRRLKKKAQKIILRWMNSTRAAVFDNWRDHAMQQVRLTRTAAGVVLRWRSRTLAQAFLRWDDNVRWMVKSKGILTRSLARWYDNVLYSAWHTWVLHAQKSQMEAKSVARVVIRWKINDIARAFLGWSSRTHEAKKLRRRMTAALNRWFALRLNAAFNQWESETARLKRYREALVHSLQVWQQPCVGRAWNQWKSQQSQSAHFRAVGGKIIQKMLHYKLSLGFFTWQSRVADMKRMSAIMQGVLRRWMFRTLSLAWDLWNEFVAQVQQEREAEYSEVEKRISHHRSQTAIGIVHEHFQTAIKNLINRLDKTRLFKHLWVWRMHSTFVYDKAVVASNRAMYKWMGGNLAKAFDAWQYGVAHTKQIRAQCTRIITRMLHFSISRAYDRWCQFTAQRALVRHAARRWLLKTLVAAFETWCGWFDEECARNLESSKKLAMASKKQRCAAKVEFVLNMEFDRIAGHEEDFMEYFIKDVAGAVNADPGSMHVLGLQPGSIVVKLGLEDEEGIPAMSRAQAIEQQAKDPQSALRKHQNTFSGNLVRAAVVKDKNWWKWRDVNHCAATLQRLLHNQAHYFRISMSEWCFDQWRSVVKSRGLEDRLAHLEASNKKIATESELDASTAVKIELLFFGLDAFGEREFKDALIQDVAGALDGTPEKIRILRIHHPYLTLGLAEGVCGHHKSAMDVAHELVRQVHDPQSPLKHPSYTHYSPKIQAAKILVGDVSVITTRFLNTCKHTVKRMLHIGLAVAFDGFCERVLEIKKKKARAKHIVQRMQHFNLAAAFDRFYEVVVRLKRQHAIIARTVAKWKTPVLEACWNGWLDACDESRHVRHEEAHQMAKLKLIDHIQDAALRRSEYMKRFLRMWEKRPMLSALHKWIYTVCSIKTARRAIRRMQHLKLASAFCRFCESVRILESRRRIISLALAKWRMPLLAWCMQEWMSAVDEVKQEAREAAFELARAELQQQEVEDNEMAGLQLPGHVGSLIEVDVQQEEYHLTDAEILQLDVQQQIEQERARLIDRCSRTVKRMLHIGLAVAFDGFCERVLEIREKKARSKHIIQRMQHFNLAAAFDRFHEVVVRLKRQHAMIARTLGRWTRSPVELCFSEWLRYVDDRNMIAAEIAHQRLEAQLTGQITPGHLEGEVGSVQASMLEAVDSLIEVDVEQEEYHLTDFDILQLDVQQQVEQEKARLIDRCSRTVKRMLHIGLAVAFDGFCERVLEIREKKARSKHIIQRMQHFNLAAAFDRFHEVVVRLKRQHAMIARTLGRWTRSPVELCFSEWLRYVDDRKMIAAEIAHQRLEAQLSEHVDRQLRKKEEHITRLLRKWREMPKLKAWNAWCHMHNVMNQCKRALRRMRNIRLASAFETLHEAVDRLKRLHGAVSRAIVVWQRPAVEWCFELWVGLVDDVRTEAQNAAHELARSRIESAFVGQAEETTQLRDQVATLLKNQQESRNKLIQRVLTRMTHLRLATAFDHFHEEADQRRRRRQIITRCLGRWRAPLLEWGWEHWLVCVADSRRAAAEAAGNLEVQKSSEQRKAEYCLAKCLSLWLNRCYTRAFHTWLAVCQHSRRIRFLGSRAVRRIFWHTSARCFDHWLDVALNLKATRGRMMRYLRLWIHRQLKSAFFTWAENAMELIEARVTVLRQQQEYQKDERRLDATAVKIVHRGLCRLLHFALLRWYQETVEISKFIGAARKIVQRWQQASRREMLKRWVAGADVQQKCRRRWRGLVAMRSLLALQELAVGMLDIADSDPNGHFAFDQQAPPLSTHTAHIHLEVPPVDGLPQARGPDRAVTRSRYVERSDEWDELSEENLEWDTAEEDEEAYENYFQVQGVML